MLGQREPQQKLTLTVCPSGKGEAKHLGQSHTAKGSQTRKGRLRGHRPGRGGEREEGITDNVTARGRRAKRTVSPKTTPTEDSEDQRRQNDFEYVQGGQEDGVMDGHGDKVGSCVSRSDPVPCELLSRVGSKLQPYL